MTDFDHMTPSDKLALLVFCIFFLLIFMGLGDDNDKRPRS